MSEILQITNLTKTYPGRDGDVVALGGVSFGVEEHSIVGLLGPNGAGKTTLVKCATGLIVPTEGTVTVDGVDVVKHTHKALTRIAAVLEGNRNVFWRLTTRENLEYFAGLHGIRRKDAAPMIDELISVFDLEEKADVQARRLSRGMQQRLAVACVLVKRTPVLILDEPTLGLDVASRLELRRALQALSSTEWLGQRTIVIASHDMALVEALCSRVVVINRGRVVVDDDIANLPSLLGVSTFRVVVDGPLSEGQVAWCAANAISSEVSEEGRRTTVDVNLCDGVGFFDLVDMLRGGPPVVSVGQLERTLEEVFLSVISEAVPR